MNVGVATGNLHSNTTQNAYMTILESNKTAEKQSESTQSKLILHYTHEERFSSFKSDMHHIYHIIFHQIPAAEEKLLVTGIGETQGVNSFISVLNQAYYKIKKGISEIQSKKNQRNFKYFHTPNLEP